MNRKFTIFIIILLLFVAGGVFWWWISKEPDVGFVGSEEFEIQGTENGKIIILADISRYKIILTQEIFLFFNCRNDTLN